MNTKIPENFFKNKLTLAGCKVVDVGGEEVDGGEEIEWRRWTDSGRQYQRWWMVGSAARWSRPEKGQLQTSDGAAAAVRW